MILLIVVLVLLRDADFNSRPVLFLALLVGTIGTLVLEALVVTRTQVPYTESPPHERARRRTRAVRAVRPRAPTGARRPSRPAPGKAPMHPALEPTGEHVAHSAIGSLVGGVVVWGRVGLLLDHWLGTGAGSYSRGGGGRCPDRLRHRVSSLRTR